MKSIHFHSLDDLLAFLMRCENYGLLGDNPEDYEFLHVGAGNDAPHYALEFDEGLWPQADSMAPLFAGSIGYETLDSGRFTKVHVNELFLALPLQQQAQSRGYLPSLLLGCKAGTDDDISALVQILYAAWREVPKSDEEESIFRFSFGRTRWLTVEIPSIQPGFVFRKFQETLSGGPIRDKVTGRDISLSAVKTFLPAWSGREDCFLFVESGYGYPKPLEFSSLYHPTVCAQRDFQGRVLPMEIDHVVLLERDPLVKVGGAGLWVQSKSYLLGSATDDGSAPEEERFIEFSRSGDIYDLQIHKFDRWPEFIQSFPITEASHKLGISLKLGDTSQSVGFVHELEARIGRHQRSIEELESRKARLQTLADGEYLPIFVFEQPDPDKMGAGLSGFLKRPLSELARFLYLRARIPDSPGFEHYIISDVRMPVSQILATPCDRIYLCEGRWWDWGLNLFLRADTSLSFPLNEPGIIRNVRDTIERLDSADRLSSGYLLAEPVSGSNGNASPIRFRILLPPEGDAVRPLDEMLFFTNELGTGTGSILEAAAIDFEVQARDHIVKADEETALAGENLCARAVALTAAAEQEWEAVRNRAQSVVTQARMAEAALSAAETAYREAPRSWVTFMNQVHLLDGFLSKARMEAFGRWYHSEADRAVQSERIRLLKLDVSQEIQEMSERAIELQEVLSHDLEDLKQEAGQLEALLQNIRRQNSDTEELSKRFAANAAAAEEQLRRFEAEKNALLDGQRKAKAAQNAAEKKLAEIEAEREAFRMKKEELAETDNAVRQRKAENEIAVAQFNEETVSLSELIEDSTVDINKALDLFFRTCENQLNHGEKLLEDRKAFSGFRKKLGHLSKLRERDDTKDPGFFARLFGRKS